MLDHLLALFGSASTFEAADVVRFQGVIFADAAESEHTDASAGRIHQPIFTLAYM